MFLEELFPHHISECYIKWN